MLEDLTRDSNDIFEKEAANRIIVHSRDFARDLMIKSQLLAPAGSKVTVDHVQKTWLKLRNESRNRWLRRGRELLIFIGGAFFSVLAQTIMTQPTSIPLGQVILGILGLALVFVGVIIDS
jgi:hypothetical protein